MNEKPKGPPPPKPPAVPRPNAGPVAPRKPAVPPTPPLSAAKPPAPKPPPPEPAKEAELDVGDLASVPPEAEAASRSKIPLTVAPAPKLDSAAPVAATFAVPAAPPVAVPQVVAPLAAPLAPPEKEARRYERLPFEVTVGIASETNFYAGLTLNISEGGIFVATHEVHPVGTPLEISLALPGDQEPTTIRTVVRWVRTHSADDGGQPGLGLSFVDLPPEVFARIQRFVKNRDPLYYED